MRYDRGLSSNGILYAFVHYRKHLFKPPFRLLNFYDLICFLSVHGIIYLVFFAVSAAFRAMMLFT